MIGRQDEDSWGGSRAARGKRSLARKSTVMEQATHMSSFIQLVRL
ncbi:hypothetical protein [Priestia megaterium]|nr:hypothetical protein [Priestia megaterium]